VGQFMFECLITVKKSTLVPSACLHAGALKGRIQQARNTLSIGRDQIHTATSERIMSEAGGRSSFSPVQPRPPHTSIGRKITLSVVNGMLTIESKACSL